MECFKVYANEIEGRLDPFYYKPEFVKPVRKIKESNFGFVRFGEIIQDISGGATPRIGGDFYLYSGIPFLRVQNITEEGINLEDVKFIKKEVHEKMLKRSQLHENELVFTITGRIGSVAVVPKNFEGNINQHSVRIKLKEYFSNNQILPEYIALFFNLKIGRMLSFRKTTGGTRPALDYEAIKDLVIPLPDTRKQKELIDRIKQAYSLKKAKESSAQQLLDSIDDYVLDELGIKLPELKDKMCYAVNYSSIRGRVDPYYYQPKFAEVEKAIERGKFEIKELMEFIKISNELENINNYETINYIDLASINKDLGSIQKIKQISSKEAPSRAKQKIERGDLLVSSLSGSLKSIAVFREEGNNYIASTGFYVIKKSEEYNNYFLFALFRSLPYQIIMEREATGAIMPAINRDSFLNLKIPLPPLEIQNKIAEEVKARMQKAEKLQEEAKSILEEAKEKVERIILGNEEI